MPDEQKRDRYRVQPERDWIDSDSVEYVDALSFEEAAEIYVMAAHEPYGPNRSSIAAAGAVRVSLLPPTSAISRIMPGEEIREKVIELEEIGAWNRTNVAENNSEAPGL